MAAISFGAAALLEATDQDKPPVQTRSSQPLASTAKKAKPSRYRVERAKPPMPCVVQFHTAQDLEGVGVISPRFCSKVRIKIGLPPDPGNRCEYAVFRQSQIVLDPTVPPPATCARAYFDIQRQALG